jgi:uncharacterized protein YneF (UPF0154 family)
MSEKKGLSPWAWVAIGCGGLLLVAMIVMVAGGMFVAKKVGDFAEDFEENPAAAAEMLVKMNPDLELVESDRDAGTITIRNKQDGEVITVNYQDLQEGKLSFETAEGEVTFSATGDDEEGLLTVTKQGEEMMRIGGAEMEDVPSWVPVFPGAMATGTYSATTADGMGGSFQLTTAESVDEVMAFYAEQLEGGGWSVQKSAYSGADGNGGQIMASDEERTVIVIVSSTDEGAEATVNYSENP